MDGEPSFDELLQRIHPAASRVKLLLEQHPCLFVMFDLLVNDRGEALVDQPLEHRRRELERWAKKFLRSSRIVLSPATRDFQEAKRWFQQMHGLPDGVIAKRVNLPCESVTRKGIQNIKNRRRIAWCADAAMAARGTLWVRCLVAVEVSSKPSRQSHLSPALAPAFDVHLTPASAECRILVTNMSWRNQLQISVLGFVAAGAMLAPANAQNQPYKAPRTADGKPNLNGIWQAMNSANWDLAGHSAQAGQVVALGATGAEPPGIGVVEGGEIPYLPAAAQKKKENYANRLKLDPEVKCYLPGVPRATYMPFPFQIVQTGKVILISYEYDSAVRTIYMDNPGPAPVDSWMGWSAGHWDGDTLVVDVTGLNDQSWFDRAGDFHSDMLHVVERYTPVSANVLNYEATIEDPQVFSRPWKISMPLYKHVEKNAQLLEFKCVEFVEELLYGHLRKQPSK